MAKLSGLFDMFKRSGKAAPNAAPAIKSGAKAGSNIDLSVNPGGAQRVVNPKQAITSAPPAKLLAPDTGAKFTLTSPRALKTAGNIAVIGSAGAGVGYLLSKSSNSLVDSYSQWTNKPVREYNAQTDALRDRLDYLDDLAAFSATQSPDGSSMIVPGTGPAPIGETADSRGSSPVLLLAGVAALGGGAYLLLRKKKGKGGK